MPRSSRASAKAPSRKDEKTDQTNAEAAKSFARVLSALALVPPARKGERPQRLKGLTKASKEFLEKLSQGRAAANQSWGFRIGDESDFVLVFCGYYCLGTIDRDAYDALRGAKPSRKRPPSRPSRAGKRPSATSRTDQSPGKPAAQRRAPRAAPRRRSTLS